jgi:hypothetical protein
MVLGERATQAELDNIYVLIRDLTTCGVHATVYELRETGDGYSITKHEALAAITKLETMGYVDVEPAMFEESDCVILRHPQHSEYYLSFASDDDLDDDLLYMVKK